MTRISPFARRYVRKRATELMSDQCTIIRPGSSRVTYDPATRRTKVTGGAPIYEGRCRVWEVTSGTQINLGAEEYVMTTLYVSIPYDAPVPEVEDEILITASDDTSLVGKSLKILGIIRGGGLRASRRMAVQHIDSKKTTY